MKISIIGAGGWGTALAIKAAKNNEVVLWSHSQEEIEEFQSKGENTIFLSGVKLPESIILTNNVSQAADADALIFVVPSQFFRGILKRFENDIKPETILGHASKGFEYTTHMRLSEVMSDELEIKAEDVVVLSGPTHAEEVALDVPSALVAASKNTENAITLQEALSDETFRIYTHDDVIGVEICGAVKNVIALAAGMVREFKFGDNTLAALITRGLAEIRRLGVKMGANLETFSGLAGMGDLIVTCMSEHSRNNQTGKLLAQGKTIDEIKAGTKKIAEGVETVRTTVELQKELDVRMPISQAVYDIIYLKEIPMNVLKRLMIRPLIGEYE